jgi:cold shock CspA family protein
MGSLEGKVGTATPDVFVHISDIERSGLMTLSAGQIVEYDVFEGRNGRRSAQNLKLITAPGTRRACSLPILRQTMVVGSGEMSLRHLRVYAADRLAV